MDPSRGDSRYNLNYSMSSIGLSLSDQADLYGNPGGLGGGGGAARPPSGGLIQSMGRSAGGGTGGGGGGGLMGHGGGSGSGSGGGGAGGQCQSLGGGQSRGIKRTSSDCYDDHHRGGGGGTMTSQTLQGLESCGSGNGGGGQTAGNVPDVVDDSYTAMQNKKSPPANGKKTKGRVKIKMEYIDNKLRRYTTFSKRKTGIMKKAYELSTLTGTQVMLLVASETGHVYTFATRKLQPMITSEAGKQLIQTCLNSPDPPSGGGGGDQRMSATGFEETELSYNIADEDSKDDRSPLSSGNESDDSSDVDSPGPPSINNSQTMLTDSPNIDHPSSFHQRQSQGQSSSGSSSHFDDLKPPTLAQLSGINNVLYSPSALANIPQEVLLSLVQSGHLQLHSEDDGSGHQFITIPFSMPGSGGGGGGGGGATAGSSSGLISAGSVGGQAAHVSATNSSKLHIRDLSTKTGGGGGASSASATSTATTSSSAMVANGRETPPKEGLRIKREIID